ncbi:MAG: futalosine hydrolase [Acidobacteria bacterium]|nr:futalosine hydrolase [Acidobacteriota bacterium]
MASGGQPVVVAVATEPELRPLRDRLADGRTVTVGGRRCHFGILGGRPVRLLLTGPGAVNAAQAVTALLERTRPALVVGMGCAGVFRPSGLRPGDVAVAREEIDVQSGIEAANGTGAVIEYPFPLLERDGRGYTRRFPCATPWDATAGEVIRRALAPEEVMVERGAFIAVATITATRVRADMLWAAYQPLMETMEGAALAQVSLHYGVPFLDIRAGSNWVGPRDRDSWQVELASRRAARGVAAVIAELHRWPPLAGRGG